MPGRQHAVLALMAFLALCFAVAGIGSLFSTPAVRSAWFSELAKPAWNPPNWLFGPVWTLLYILMAIAAWLVWRERGWAGAALPLSVFFIQLAINLAWSLIFFGAHRIGLAFADIVLLWLAILTTILLFWRISPLAGGLLLPYLLWVSFAGALNFAIWQMNQGSLTV